MNNFKKLIGNWRVVALLCIAFILLLLAFSLTIISCGKIYNTSSSTGNYTVTGKINNLSIGSAIKVAATVTHIVAIDSNNQKTLANLSSDGTFSLSIDKGYPIILGFYNKTGTAITLLGHLKQSDVDWDSLPIINPSGSATDLGTIEVDTTEKKATPAIDLTSLLSKMNFTDQTTAAYYGQMDDAMTVLTNLDVDGNGVFDFQESKSYLFWADFQFATSNEVSNMINQFAENFRPSVESYSYQFIFTESGSSIAGTRATMQAPGGLAGQTFSGTAASNRTEWVYSFAPATKSPITPPSGTCTVEVTGVGTYRFSNFQAGQISYVGASENIVFPVIKLTTDEAGYVTRIDYKWKIIKNGTARDANTDELNTVEDTTTSPSKGFSHSSPFVSFTFNDGISNSPLIIPRGQGYLTINTLDLDTTGGGTRKVARTDIQSICIAYNLTSRVVHRFFYN
ncbi:MAG: hypothetical protein FD145_1147 [Candidatus Saganbacteria bacterium]|uniref:Uncharacterized protein n=1 Tax=Candidatus Saganbacteria bacterium TaxID=2575572 RepID=A0A833L0F4_UNCSA|nr:MAG: hypothetical protein FD145_1147 [Candidatus Saganbacteria bacterium]